MPKRWLIITIAVFTAITILSYSLLLNPTFQEKLGWHLNQWAGWVRVKLNPPQEVSFSSEGSDESLSNPDLLITTITPEPTRPEQTITPTVTLEPIPSIFTIEGGEYYSQHNHWNYCGPANLAMLLSYWDYDFTHDDVARGVRTFNKDKNIMPYELQDFTQENTDLGMIVRVGGSMDLLKHLIAAGYPVLIEKGPTFRDITYNVTWMGHYQTLTGYNDQEGYFIAQDSYIEANYHQDYESLESEWRSFNYTYLVAFPSNELNDVLNMLGSNADETQNYKNALQKAQDEIYEFTGVNRFFAMFNYGSNLVKLRDYNGAATAYERAFAIYDALPDDSTKPYRILWYQTGPFLAYYYTGRYTDVIELATKNSIEMVRDDEPALEESFYWRGMAKIKIGDKSGGIEDFNTCLDYHQDFQPCVEALNEQGIYP